MNNKMSNDFNKALGNFITDFAGGGAVRHLADEGYTISEIMDRLDYPMSKEKIGEIVWDHFLNQGVICLKKPSDTIEKVSYVKEQDAYGRISMRRVVEKIDAIGRDYIKVDFGKRRYQNEEAFFESLMKLDSKDREYVLDLPWPLEPVYHLKNDKITRIIKDMGDMNV